MHTIERLLNRMYRKPPMHTIERLLNRAASPTSTNILLDRTVSDSGLQRLRISSSIVQCLTVVCEYPRVCNGGLTRLQIFSL